LKVVLGRFHQALYLVSPQTRFTHARCPVAFERTAQLIKALIKTNILRAREITDAKAKKNKGWTHDPTAGRVVEHVNRRDVSKKAGRVEFC
jgi:hypothetical protein